jgi:hypothetical protein
MAPWRLTMSRCTRRSTSRTWSRPALRAAACGGCPRPRCYPRLGLSARRVAPASRSRYQEAGHLNALPPLWRAVTRRPSAMLGPAEGQQ